VLAGSVLLWVGSAAQAQQRGRVRIDAIRVGFPAGIQQDASRGDWEAAPLFKVGFWTPVYIDLTAGTQGFQRDEAVVVVEASDGDGLPTQFTVAVPPLQPSETCTVLAYTRPGSLQNDLTISVQNRANGQNLCRPEQKNARDLVGLTAQQLLYVSIGARLAGLRAAIRRDEQRPERPQDLEKLAHFDSIQPLPELWFAYSAVDLVILNTSNREQVLALLDDKDERIQRKLQALAEWVRQGGKLVVCAGRNRDVVAKLPEIEPLLPVRLDGSVQLAEVRASWQTGVGGERFAEVINPTRNGQPAPLEITRLVFKPQRHGAVLMTAPPDHLLAVESAVGLGRVIVLAFDADQLTAWPRQADFWERLLTDANPQRQFRPREVDQPQFFSPREESNDLLAGVVTNLETFDDVPVISFGWVALFILVYILIVGPLDYLFLKVILNRLELTWITFPVVVALVSGLAYFTAYWLKGSDLKVNKVDVVDIDLANQQVYGTSWFTLFSPRIYHYTLGLEPSPDWGVVAEAERGPNVMMTWLARADDPFGRRESHGLFRRAYEYEVNASGLRGVPIQVWSEKSFLARWHAALDPARPLLTAQLERVFRAPVPVAGQITSHLPLELEDVVLVTGAGGGRLQCFRLGRLVPGIPRSIDGNLEAVDWLNHLSWSTSGSFFHRGWMIDLVKEMMFHDIVNTTVSNASVRYLDESWRLQHEPEVVMIYGKAEIPDVTAGTQGLSAEAASLHPHSPSRLWLGDLPGPGKTRPELAGTLKQSTHVRILLRVP
jgi:hypothetical protein